MFERKNNRLISCSQRTINFILQINSSFSKISTDDESVSNQK